MKREVTQYICDRCGKVMPNDGYHIEQVHEESYVGVKVTYFYNGGGEKKYDLCAECTENLVGQWLDARKKKLK